MPVIEIDTLEHPGLAPYSSLTEAAIREGGIFIAESPKVIDRALDAGMTPLSLLCEKKHIRGDAAGIIERLPELTVYTGSSTLLATLTGYTLTRGVLCAMKRPRPLTAPDMLKNTKRVCVIYDVCDATNIGVIFRSAAALGYDGVLLSEGSCDPLNRRSIRVSMGTVFQIPWSFSEDVVATIKSENICSICTSLGERSISLKNFIVDSDSRYAVIFGSEGYGLPPEVIHSCNHEVKIPMHHGVDSLNVGAAAAIVLWHFAP